MSTACIHCYLNLKILRMAEQWDFTREDTRVGTKRLKQSSLLTFTKQVSIFLISNASGHVLSD